MLSYSEIHEIILDGVLLGGGLLDFPPNFPPPFWGIFETLLNFPPNFLQNLGVNFGLLFKAVYTAGRQWVVFWCPNLAHLGVFSSPGHQNEKNDYKRETRYISVASDLIRNKIYSFLGAIIFREHRTPMGEKGQSHPNLT